MLRKYALEIYRPGNRGDDVACTIESDEPFLLIQKGDLINPRTWTSHYYNNLFSLSDLSGRPHGVVLRVTGIEHFLVQTEQGFSQHKLGVFTEAVDDTDKARP
jgi:hypothetical protein